MRAPLGVQVTDWRLRQWIARTDGAAVVEFALLLPMLIILFVGGLAASQAITAYRKVVDTTVQLANVSTQYTAMTPADTSSIMAATSQIMVPYSTLTLTIKLTEITTDINGVGLVVWCQAWPTGGPCNTPGQTWPLPSGLATPSTSYMLVQSSYTYDLGLGSSYFARSIPMSYQIYMAPRQSAAIPCPSC